MLRFFLGILLIQIATVALVFFAPENLQGVAWLRLFIPLLVIGFFSAFWFSSMSKQTSKDEISQLKIKHALEREKLQINAERAKTRIIKKTQQQIAKEGKIAHGKANLKVGAALAGVVGFGALMLLTQFLTLGVVTLTTAGGALGGYLYRGRKDKNRQLGYGQAQGKNDIKIISANKSEPKKRLKKTL